MTYRFTIPLSPVSKKNHPILVKGRAVVLPSKQFTKYQKECAKFMPHIDTVATPCNIECHFYCQTRRLCDLTNQLESIDDILVHYGILEDDNYTRVVSHDRSFVSYDKDNPRTEVIITEFDYPCEICKKVSECNEDDLDYGLENAYDCFNRGRK